MDERPDPTPGLDLLELRQLRHFLAVADERNFTRAAERLHLAQQGLSSSIRRLEDQLGVALFVRTTRSVELTSAGEALVPGAQAVIEAAKEALLGVRIVAQGRAGRLRIGFSTAAGGIGLVRTIVRTFAEEAPDVEIETREHDFSDPTAGLIDGAVGVAFVFGPLAGDGLVSMTLLEEPRLVALRPEHPLAACDALGPPDIASLPWLQVPGPRGPWQAFWFPQPSDEHRPGPTIRTADEWVTAVETGRGFAFTMPSVMRDFTTARIVVRPATDMAAARVLLAWRAGDPDPVVQAFVRHASVVSPRPG